MPIRILLVTGSPRCSDIAADNKIRIAAGEFAPGDQLPPITALMEHYRVPGLNTIRQAQ